MEAKCTWSLKLFWVYRFHGFFPPFWINLKAYFSKRFHFRARLFEDFLFLRRFFLVIDRERDM